MMNRKGVIFVKGSFARNDAFCAMLAAATDCPVETAIGVTETSKGATLLVNAKQGLAGDSVMNHFALGSSVTLKGCAEQ